MVYSFIDTEFLKYFLTTLLNAKTHSKEREIIEIIQKYFLNTGLNFKSDITKILGSFEQSEKEILMHIFFNQLTTGRGNRELKTNETKPFNFLIKKNVSKQLKLPFANYWVNDKTKYSIDEYQSNNPYIFFNADNIYKNYFLIDTQKKWWVGPGAVADSNEKNILRSWKDLEVYKHNYFDIIISDKFCLKDEYRIKENIPRIIANLSLSLSNIKNIIIFVNREDIKSTSIKRAHEVLMEELHKMNMKDVKLKIFGSAKTTHDRIIITNSFHLYSGDSIDYFDLNETYKTKGTVLEISSISKDEMVLKQRFKNLIEIYDSENSEKYGEVSETNLLNLYKTLINT